MRRLLLLAVFAFVCLVQLSNPSHIAAQSYISAVGNPSFGVNIPVPNGYINIGNGNLHLEIPLATHKQRGALQLNERLVYDSRIWKIVQYSNLYWWPINVPNSSAGWRFVKGNETGTIGTASSTQNSSCWTGIFNQPYQVYTNYYNWTDPNGTVHPFEAGSTTYTVPSNCPGSGSNTTAWSGYAVDASGYYATATSDNSGNVSVTVKDSAGNQVYPQVIDRFGNFWANDGSGNLVDDLGRTPVITTTSGNVTYYDVLAPNGPISNNGTRVRYTVTTEQVTILTSFNQSGVKEYQDNGPHSATIPAIQSIGLPDGSSYQFFYDSYGEMQSVTLPTGGVVAYGWTNYTDSYQNVNRWLSSSTIAGNPTLYTPSVITQCSANGTGCQEKVNVHRPSGDETVYTMTLDNGAWDTNTTVYSGAASANQAKLATANTFNFSQACTTPGCNGAQNITKALETDSLPDANLSSQTQTVYANPKTGQMTSLGQWDFYATGSTPSALPTRQVNYGYTGFDLTSEAHLDATAKTVASTTYIYSNTATPTSGIVGHGTANAGGPYLTSVVATNNAPVGSVSTSATYEDTGALLTTTDAKLNPVTTYKYDPTHTFAIEIDKPQTVTYGTPYQHVSKASFDPNSGAILSSDDENSVANAQAYQVKYTYEPVAGRLQKIQNPKAVPTDPVGGSQTYSYPSPTEVDVTVAQTASITVTTQQFSDTYGRPYQTTSGSITTTQGYDVNGRAYSVTNPTDGTGSTIGTTYTYYDALNRVSSIQHPDATTRTLQVTGNSAVATDEIGNQSKQIFNAFGELTAVFEADPNTGALTLETDYKQDALGNVICVEQHGNVSGTGCSAPSSSDAASPWRVRRFFYNSLSQLTAASIPEHTFLPSSPAQQNCVVGTVGGPWTDCHYYDPNGNQTGIVDNRGVKRTYTYDALNRPLLKTSPNGTTQDLWYDGGTNAVGYLSHQSNDMSAAASYAYDTVGKLISEADCRPSNCATAYVSTSATYDLAGNRTSITYPDSRVVASSYDMLNRLSGVTYKQWGPTLIGTNYWSAVSYAAPGLLQTANYGNGVQMQAGFNNRLSLTSLSYQTTSPAPPQTFFSKTYLWDKNAANLNTEINQTTSQQRQFGYDKLNRLVSAADVASSAAYATGTATLTGFEGFTCGGGLGNQPAVQGPSPAIIGPCTKVYDTGTVYLMVSTFTVSANYFQGSTTAKLATTLAGLLNGTGSPVKATASGAVITLTSLVQGASANYALSYSSDGDFNVTFSGANMTGGSTGVPVPGGLNQQYTLDAWGNLSSMGNSGFNQAINGHNQIVGPQYDAAGRLTTDSLTYAYDDDGMLVTSSDGTSYVYDAVGARAQIAKAGVSKEYYYFGGQLIATLNPAQGSAGWTDFINVGGQKIAVVAGNQTALPVYTLPDHLGSEIASVNNNETSSAALDYTPFGQVISGTSTDPFVFTGLERDSDGLDHAGFRQYSSATGRWTTPDPYDGSYVFGSPQSLNRYSYVSNTPLYSTDPSGLTPTPLGCGFSIGGEGAGIVFSAGLSLADIPADIGLASCIFSGIEDILHFFGRPKFKGSLRPRPNARIWDEHGSYRPKAAGISSLFGLPSGGCEFGACGSSFFQNTPVHGPWHYGNWCGAGGMGTPINVVDGFCMAHDLNFGKTGADWTNMQSDANWNKLRPDQQKQVQQYNQQLCDGVAKASIPWWNTSEKTAAWEIGVFFHSHVPKGAQCH